MILKPSSIKLIMIVILVAGKLFYYILCTYDVTYVLLIAYCIESEYLIVIEFHFPVILLKQQLQIINQLYQF